MCYIITTTYRLWFKQTEIFFKCTASKKMYIIIMVYNIWTTIERCIPQIYHPQSSLPKVCSFDKPLALLRVYQNCKLPETELYSSGPHLGWCICGINLSTMVYILYLRISTEEIWNNCSSSDFPCDFELLSRIEKDDGELNITGIKEIKCSDN